MIQASIDLASYAVHISTLDICFKRLHNDTVLITRKSRNGQNSKQFNKERKRHCRRIRRVIYQYSRSSADKLRSTLDQAWTLTEAANAYNVTERTVRRWIKEQVVSAWKVDGPRGPEWRINSGSTMDKNQVHAGSTVDLETVTVPEQTASMLETDRLWELLKEKDAKIEALIMRTGYLQAQMETKEEQIKLLTDSQHKQSWWYRVWKRIKG